MKKVKGKSKKVKGANSILLFHFITLCFCAVVVDCYFTGAARAQSGGDFAVTQSVIAAGGQQSAGDNFSVFGTAGQPTAGTNSAGGGFNLRGGFLAGGTFAPTAAEASIGGRVFSGKGAGIIRRVRIRLFDLSNGIERTTQTNPFGFYRFDELEVGRTYIVRAESSNYVFTPAQYFLTLLEDREDINFTGGRNFFQIPNYMNQN